MRLVSYIFFLLVALLGISFACLNAYPVSFNYYFGVSTIPLSFLLTITLAIGACLGLLVSLATYIRLKGQNLRLQRHIKLVDKELTHLRTLPLKESP